MSPQETVRYLSIKQFTSLCNTIDMKSGANTKFEVLRVKESYNDHMQIQVIYKRDRKIDWITIKS